MSATQLVARVRHLAASLAEPGAAAAECEELMHAALGLEALEGGDTAALQRAVSDAAASLVSADQQLQSEDPASTASLRRHTAACRLGIACNRLIRLCGSSLLEELGFTKVLIGLLTRSGLGLAAAMVAGSSSGDSGSAGGPALAVAAAALEAQMHAMSACVLTGQPTLACMPPRQPTAWLAAVVAALRHLQAAPAAASGAAKARLEAAHLIHLPTIAATFVAHTDYQPLHAALCRGTLRAEVAAVLLPALSRVAVVLPLPPERRPPGLEALGWLHVNCLGSTVGAARLGGAVREWIAGADGSARAAALCGAAQLVLQLPLDFNPPGLPPGDQPHFQAAAFVTNTLGVLCNCAAEPAPQPCVSSEQRRRMARQVLKAIAHLPAVFQLMARLAGIGGAANNGCSSSNSTGSGRSSGSHGGGSSGQGHVASDLAGMTLSMTVSTTTSTAGLLQDFLNEYLTSSLNTRAPTTGLLASLDDVSDWARAVAAALRIAPVLAAIDRRFAQEPVVQALPPSVLPPAELLVQLLGLASRTATAINQFMTWTSLPLSGSASLGAACTAVWQLHTAGCRLVHWAAADGWCSLADPVTARNLLRVLSESLKAALDLHDHEQLSREGAGATAQRTSSPCRELEAMACGHWAAVQALAAARDLLTLDCPPAWAKLAVGLAVCMGKGPPTLAVDPALHHLFGQMVDRIPRDPGTRWQHFWLIWAAGIGAPRLVAHLLASGQLAAMLAEVQGYAAAGHLGRAEADQLLATLDTLASTLQDEARQLARSVLADPTRDSAEAREAALSGVEAIMELLALPRSRGTPTAQQLAEARARMVPPLRRLAEGLQALCDLPDQQEEAALQAAKAAAARSCAFLRCGNVGGGGGPAAREGEGSQRCSGCRCVW
ncbi:hypothetical protein ABPG75_002103 [Micractinium tetrahymenae]